MGSEMCIRDRHRVTMSSSINPTPDLSFMSAAVGDNTDSSSSSKNGDRNNVFDQISANDDNAS